MSYRASFVQSALTLVQLTEGVTAEQWSEPGLGVWDVRSLVGHASRALTTVIEYERLPSSTSIDFETASDYFALLAGYKEREQTGAGDAEIAKRGVEAGRVLGEDPVAVVTDLVRAALQSAEATADDAVIVTRFGKLPFGEYLGTRVFELVVHGLDIARATGQPVELINPVALTETLALATDISVRTRRGVDLLLAITGRQPLDPGFSIT